ncbi:MAG: rhodanese-like domain-containing protein [Candidatus Protochlamydia sp.]|nr:rhodanese-like domain-containing protein [Candidatus Protochlamydia sp.]
MFYKILSLVLLTAPLTAISQPPSTMVQQIRTTIKADELKSWYDQKKPMVIIDARSEKYFDGRLLPTAKWLPSETSEKEILAHVPSKDSLIVVYCAGVKCPASGWLYDKLYSMGYHNLYEYHEGIQEWTQKGYPIIQTIK